MASSGDSKAAPGDARGETNGDAVALRLAREGDLAAAAQLAAALIRLHHTWDERRFFVVAGLEAGYERFLREELANPAACIFVATRAEAVVGYAYATLEPRNWSDLRDACGKLHDVFVAPEHRGAGVAQALVTATTDWLRARGAPRVVLMVATANTAGQALFARLGFRPTMQEMTLELDDEAPR